MKIERIGDAKDLMKKGFLALLRENGLKEMIAMPMFVLENQHLRDNLHTEVLAQAEKNYKKVTMIDNLFHRTVPWNNWGANDAKKISAIAIDKGYFNGWKSVLGGENDIGGSLFLDPDMGIDVGRIIGQHKKGEKIKIQDAADTCEELEELMRNATGGLAIDYIKGDQIAAIHQRVPKKWLIIYDESIDRRAPERVINEKLRRLEIIYNANLFKAFTYWAAGGPSFVVIAPIKSQEKNPAVTFTQLKQKLIGIVGEKRIFV